MRKRKIPSWRFSENEIFEGIMDLRHPNTQGYEMNADITHSS